VALLHDYTSGGAAAFCGAESGCGAVRESGFGYIPLPGAGFLPVPVLGILAFATLFAGSLLRTGDLREKIVLPVAYASALGAVIFLGIQVYIWHFCYLCVTVDLMSLVVGYCAYCLRNGGFDVALTEEQSRTTLIDPHELMSEGQTVKGVWREDSQIYEAPNSLVKPPPREPMRLKFSTWITLSVLFVVAPALFPSVVYVSEVPSSIRELYDPSALTVVEFFDYQCPHCRDLSPRLKAIVQEDKSVHLRLGYTPFPSHQLARDAARVTICAAEQDKEWEVAAVLFTDSDLSLPHITEIATGIVKDKNALAACLASELPDKRIAADIARITEAGWEALPTTYVGGTRILGAEQDLVYRDALRRAKEGTDVRGLNPWIYWAAMLAALMGIVLSGRVPPPDRRSIPG